MRLSDRAHFSGAVSVTVMLWPPNAPTRFGNSEGSLPGLELGRFITHLAEYHACPFCHQHAVTILVIRQGTLLAETSTQL